MESTHGSSGSTARFLQGAAAVIFLLALAGCGYGKLVLLPPAQEDIHTFVEERYDGLDASYSGITEKPGAIRFDIKGDGIELTGSGWQPLGSKEAIFEIVRNMQVTYRKYKGFVGVLGPRLYAIMDQENRTIGYIYSPLDNITVRPDGPNFQVDALTELDVRNLVYPSWGNKRRDGMGGGRR